MSSLLDAKPIAFEALPIIDLTYATSEDEEKRHAIADELRRACQEVGFFYVKEHGVADDTIKTAFHAAKTFFDLSEQAKKAVSLHNSTQFRGYNALLEENVDPTARGDLNEGFNVGPPRSFAEGDDSDPNQWPIELEGTSFQADVMAYYEAANALARRILPLLAVALGLPESFFEAKTQQSANFMRLLHYPPQLGDVDDRQIGIGAHSDYEVLTILATDETPALQVMNLEGKWIAAPPIPGCFICNLGDQIARWSNDVFLSTTHRAINRTGVERYSIPLFVGTDYDVLLEPLPTCVSKDRPARYEPVLAGDFVRSRLDATYQPKKDV